MKAPTIIVQARNSSVRFPNKMVKLLGDNLIIEWVLKRLTRARSVGSIILATTDNKSDEILHEIALSLKVNVFKGSEADVLQRFVRAADCYSAETVIRVCADNPFVDPGEIDRLVENFNNSRCDYAFNHLNRLNSGYADGFGAEILSRDSLDRIAKIATKSDHREHVTKYIWDNPREFSIFPVIAPDELRFPNMQFDVDSPKDLEYLRILVSNGVTIETKSADIIRKARGLNVKT